MPALHLAISKRFEGQIIHLLRQFVRMRRCHCYVECVLVQLRRMRARTRGRNNLLVVGTHASCEATSSNWRPGRLTFKAFSFQVCKLLSESEIAAATRHRCEGALRVYIRTYISYGLRVEQPCMTNVLDLNRMFPAHQPVCIWSF